MNYKEQLEKWQEANKIAVTELERSATALSVTAEKTLSFVDSANRLEEISQKVSYLACREHRLVQHLGTAPMRPFSLYPRAYNGIAIALSHLA
jgi:hypothetical protein